jgi:hypothetical protein
MLQQSGKLVDRPALPTEQIRDTVYHDIRGFELPDPVSRAEN